MSSVGGPRAGERPFRIAEKVLIDRGPALALMVNEDGESWWVISFEGISLGCACADCAPGEQIAGGWTSSPTGAEPTGVGPLPMHVALHPPYLPVTCHSPTHAVAHRRGVGTRAVHASSRSLELAAGCMTRRTCRPSDRYCWRPMATTTRGHCSSTHRRCMSSPQTTARCSATSSPATRDCGTPSRGPAPGAGCASGFSPDPFPPEKGNSDGPRPVRL